MTRAGTWQLSLFALLTLGCSTVEPAAIGVGALTGSVGVLHVERTALANQALDDSAVLRAAFARYDGIDGDAVLRLLGSGPASELERCVLTDPGARPLDGGLGGGLVEPGVELVDVGALEVEVTSGAQPGVQTELSARTFPELASVLAGVFYAEELSATTLSPRDLSAGDSSSGDTSSGDPSPETSPGDPSAERIAAPTEYRFVAAGSVEVGSFDVVLSAVDAPRGVTLTGADGTGGALSARVTDIATTGDLVLGWEAGDPADVVEIEFRAAGRTLACTTRDEGAYAIAAADLAGLGTDPDALLLVRRVRVEPFDAAGMDVVYARSAAARTFPLTVR